MFARKDIDVTVFRVALIATATAVTAIGIASTAHADPEYQLFQDASGNIKCETTISYKGDPYANCTVRNAAYTVPADKCDFAGPANAQFGLTQGSTPSLSCVVASGDYQWPTIDFGQTRSVGTVTCDNEPQGMTCTDAGTGHFFRISTDSYNFG